METSLLKTIEHVRNDFNLKAGMIVSGVEVAENRGNIYETPVPVELEGKIYELEGLYAGYNHGNNTIDIVGQECKYTILPIDDTVYSNSIIAGNGEMLPINKKDRLYVIAIWSPDSRIYVAVTIIRFNEKVRFRQVKSLYGRALAIKKIYCQYKNSPDKIEYIFDQTDSPLYERYELADDYIFESREEQMLKYALTKETYRPETQRAYEMFFRDPAALKHKTEHKLKLISSISPQYKDRKSIDGNKLRKMLDERLYKLDKVKQQIIDVLVSNEHAGKRAFNMLLVGSPGVGKTSIMETIAESVNLPYEIIPLNGLACPLELEGLDSSYEGADAGRLIQAFAAHGTSEMLIGFDEIDKMCRNSKEGDPMNVLYRMLTGFHVDKFLDCPVSTENTIFIATANSVENIPEPIMNRFNSVIYIEDYTTDDKIRIAFDYIIPIIIKKYNLRKENIRFTDSAVKLIITDYCEDGGARDLEHNIDMIVRRVISIGKAKEHVCIKYSDVKRVLDYLVPETPGILFNKHRDEYSKEVASEIRRCLDETKVSANSTDDRFASDKMRQKMEFLMACRNENHVFSHDFDPGEFSAFLHKNLFGMDKVIKEATVFYHTLSLQGKIMNSNLALCGTYGIGKSAIVKSIADAIGYKFVKIPFNGITDVKELRGFSSTYIGSEPGRIIKGVKEAGTLNTVFQLDEIDKLDPKLSSLLLDLIDRSFTDSFLGVPVDFSNSIFIATANDWGNVPAVLRDRFIVIDVDGYTREEKAQIISDYIVPKLEEKYAASGVSISIDQEAETYLLETYCPSFGVRDAEKAMQRIVGGILVELYGQSDEFSVRVNKDDVRFYMGPEPTPRGNFPYGEVIPGVTKALAVCNGNVGNAFAIETVLLDGDESLEITGLPKESAIDSVKIAVTCIKRMKPELLRGKRIHVHFGEGAVSKDGPSAGVAIFMSIYSAAIGKPIMDKKPYDIAFTGELSLTGGVYAVSGVMEKIQAACDSGCSKVFIPQQSYDKLVQKKLERLKCEIIPLRDVFSAIAILN